MVTEHSRIKSGDPSRLTAFALGLTRYAPRGANLVAGVLLIEIGATFGLPVAVASQLNTIHSLLSLAAALAMGVLSMRFSMERLLFTGLGLALVSATASSLAPSFPLLLFLYSLNGIAWSLIYPMSVALVGELFHQKKRAGALSIIFAVPPIITVFGSPFISYIGDWRIALLLYAIPIAAASFILARIAVPVRSAKRERVELASAFKVIATNRSALSCLTYFLLENITWQIVGVLGISFLREQHHISKEIASLIYSGFAVAVFAGALSGGKIVERFGRKTSAVSLTIAYGLSAILFATVPNSYVAAALGILSCLLAGLRQPSINSLTVEQIPAMRGPLMSLSQAFENIGGMIGAAMAGLLLLSFGWVTCGVILASAALLASIILQALAKDPTASTPNSFIS